MSPRPSTSLMDLETWTAELVGLLRTDGTTSLSRGPEAKESGFDIDLVGEGESLGVSVLKNARVSKHLAAWPRADDLVAWVVTTGGARMPLILVRDGSLLVVSGDTVDALRARSMGAMPFDAWFQQLTGAPCPVDLGPLKELGENLYGPPGDTRDDYRNPNWALLRRGWRDETPAPFAAVSYAGYGCNSWAIYVTRVLGPARLFLRLRHGGVYLDPKESVPRLLQNLTSAVRLQNDAAARGIPMFLNHNMGRWEFSFEELQLHEDGFLSTLQHASSLRVVVAAMTERES